MQYLNPTISHILVFGVGALFGFFLKWAWHWLMQPRLMITKTSDKDSDFHGIPGTKYYLGIINKGRSAAINSKAQITLNNLEKEMCVSGFPVPTRGGTSTLVPHIIDPETTPIEAQGICWASGNVGAITLNIEHTENLELCWLIEWGQGRILLFPTEMAAYTKPRIGLDLEQLKRLHIPEIEGTLIVTGENVGSPLKLKLTIEFTEDYSGITIRTSC